jgi:type III secretion protein J
MALSVPLCLFLVGCSKPLFENLSERQANEVVAALLSSNIDASKAREGKQGYVVRVDKADMSDAIELVQSRNLPSRERVEISSAFPADALVSTPESERARLFSAIEQRLEQSLAVFDNVILARVHLSYDTRRSNPRRDEDVPMHVSAVLATRGEVDAEGLIQRVKRFLRNSFARVDYDNVSVVLVSAPSTPIVEVTKRPFPIGAVVSVAFGAMAAAAALCLLVWRLASRGRRSSLPVLRRNNEPPSAEK